MYPSLNLKEIRHEYRYCNCGQLGLFLLSHNKPHTVASFAQTERPLHFNPVCVVLIFLLLICGGIVSRFFRKFNFCRLVSGSQPAMLSDSVSSAML